MQAKLIKLLQPQVINLSPVSRLLFHDVQFNWNHTVSYLFRSLGSVIGLSIGSTLIQETLRSTLHKRLSGADVDKVWTFSSFIIISNIISLFFFFF